MVENHNDALTYKRRDVACYVSTGKYDKLFKTKKYRTNVET